MLVFIISVIIFLLIIVMVVITIGLLVGKSRSEKEPLVSSDTDAALKKALVSIIIPARNEADNLPALFESLENQTAKNFELIIIDDRSEDNSLKLIREFAEKSEIIVKIIVNTEDPGCYNPKVKCLLKGIKEARGDYYFFTDADCSVGVYWVANVLEIFKDDDVGLAFGMLSLTGEDNILCRLQNFDHFYRMHYAFGACSLGLPIGCFGNNLAIRKSTYFDSGGYEKQLHSATEDAELIANVRSIGKYSIREMFNKNTFIETVHKKTWNEHANQALRWTAGAVFSTNKIARFGFIALMLVILFCLFAIIPGIFCNKGFLIFPAVLYVYIYLSAVIFGLAGTTNRAYWRGMFISVLIVPFIYAVSFIKIVFKRTINWKGTIISWKGKK